MITLWTIYDHPKNIGLFVAWRSVVPERGEHLEADDDGEQLKLSTDLEAIRDQLKTLGLTCYGRDPEDAPCIIEVWLKRNESTTTATRASH